MKPRFLENGELSILVEDSSLNGVHLLSRNVGITSLGGLAVKMTNNTGAESIKGYVVRASTSAANSVELAQKNIPDPIGVFYESGIANGEEAWIVITGICEMYFIGDTTTGQFVRTFVSSDNDYVEGQAKAEQLPTTPFATDKHFCECGHLLESRTGPGLAKVTLHFN